MGNQDQYQTLSGYPTVSQDLSSSPCCQLKTLPSSLITTKHAEVNKAHSAFNTKELSHKACHEKASFKDPGFGGVELTIWTLDTHIRATICHSTKCESHIQMYADTFGRTRIGRNTDTFSARDFRCSSCAKCQKIQFIREGLDYPVTALIFPVHPKIQELSHCATMMNVLLAWEDHLSKGRSF